MLEKRFFSTVKFCNVSGGVFIGISGHIVELFLLRPSISPQTKQNTFPPAGGPTETFTDAPKMEPRPDDLSEAPVEVSKLAFRKGLAIIHEVVSGGNSETPNYQLNLHGKQLSQVVRSKKVNMT